MVGFLLMTQELARVHGRLFALFVSRSYISHARKPFRCASLTFNLPSASDTGRASHVIVCHLGHGSE